MAKYPNALRRGHMLTRDDSAAGAAARHRAPRVQLLIIIFTQRSNEGRRSWQRETWLGQRWQRGELRRSSAAQSEAPERLSWRYVYMMARDGSEDAASLDRVRGDAVTLSAVREGYENLVYKTLEAVRWALTHVAFGTLLKTDDDSIVHVGRAAAWLHHISLRAPQMARSLYAGRVFNDSQVIRHDFTKRHLLHPEWFPDDFTKWAVPYEALSTAALVHGYYYPPYCSGGGYLLGADSARRIVRAFDVRVAAKRPVVRVEDAYVGILAAEASVRPTDISELVQDPPAGRRQTPALFGGQLLVHRVAEPTKAFGWLVYPVRTAFEREERRGGARGGGGGGGGAGRALAGGARRKRRTKKR